MGGNGHILTHREMLMFPSDFPNKMTIGIKSPISWAQGPALPTSQQRYSAFYFLKVNLIIPKSNNTLSNCCQLLLTYFLCFICDLNKSPPSNVEA